MICWLDLLQKMTRRAIRKRVPQIFWHADRCYLIAEWEDTVLLGVGLALTLPQATQVTSTGSSGLEKNNIMESIIGVLNNSNWCIEYTIVLCMLKWKRLSPGKVHHTSLRSPWHMWGSSRTHPGCTYQMGSILGSEEICQDSGVFGNFMTFLVQRKLN